MSAHEARAAGTRRLGLGSWIAPPRFILFVGVAAVAGVAASLCVGWQHGCLLGFDAAALVFLSSLAPLLKESSPPEMRRHAAENDANRAVLLLIAAGVMLIVLTAIAVELSQKGNPPPTIIVLVIVTLGLSWSFTNTIFALHYAHMFYTGGREDDGDCGGIEFPGTPEPGYWDFVYFSFCLGMTFQTSDSNITAVRIRRVVIMHSMMAFVFSIGVIAFTINVIGSTGGGAEVVVVR